jgi:hypothetical protein
VIVDEPHAPAPLRLAVGGVVVELPSGFDQGELARVMEVLRRC